MTNCEKKLDALIDVLGFDIEEDKIRAGITITRGLFGPIEAQNYIYNYKLTKRTNDGIKCTKCGTHLADNSPLDACMCKTPLNLVRCQDD